MTTLHSPSRLSVAFDDDHSVANAGLALVGVLSEKLGLQQLAEETISITPFPGRRVATLVHALVAGASCIDDADVLRAGATSSVLSHRVMAPSTLGTFLRNFSFGHVRQLDRVAELLLTRAWSLGAGPGDEPMTIDIDSTICEVYGNQKQGAGYGYTHVLGYHPLLATRADTGETLHVRFRKGSANSGRGAERFVREVVGRVRRAGAGGPLTLRGDSGFFSQFVVKACRDHKVRYSITVRQNPVIRRAIESIAPDAWTPIDYTANGDAWVAETPYGDGHRLVVRRTKLSDPRPALFPTFRYHAFITDRDGDAVTLDADHRRHAVVELAIRDLKEGSGLEHCPSGDFNANAAWAVLASIAHNLVRWVGALGLEITGPLVAKTIRRKFLALPGRITHGARRRQLHLPTSWPWAAQWSSCFERLCKLQT
ncbi:MAG TPA: IS1380 family transposase [Acidimicrobiales bacterium]|nr:IS1380 family transposase [Acidimicrobiales bacterium]